MTINAAFFQGISDQAAQCNTCAELQRLVSLVSPELAKVEADIASRVATLAAAQELLTLSATDLPSALTFVSKLKTELIGPLLASYATYVTQQTETIAAVAGVSSALTSAASRIGGCSITGIP